MLSNILCTVSIFGSSAANNIVVPWRLWSWSCSDPSSSAVPAGSVERLDLRLLVDREHQRMLGRIDMEADDVLHLGGKLRVVRQLETAGRGAVLVTIIIKLPNSYC